MTTHEDDRRKLTSFPEGKILEIKNDCVVGKHYHKIKTEYFVLCDGAATLLSYSLHDVFLPDTEEMVIGKLYIIKPGTYHEFNMKAGSVLMGTCSHPFNSEDDYHL